MNAKKCTLTISILASNRKDTLPKTLESIKPILDNVSSELIVVDTGCDEELLEIIRRYTDNIQKFTWCNDFSKARNVGIENAQGDWFMFIDDDEWFEDVTPFIHFFNSDEKNRYNYAKYLVRNYSDFEGTEWTDSVVGRMFRLFEGTKFVDAIHERPINIEGPAIDFGIYAHHYGYVYSNESEKRKHSERNRTLIKKQIEAEPWAARHYVHMVQEYNVLGEFDTAVKYAYEGIEKCNSKEGMECLDNSKDVVALFSVVISKMIEEEKFERVIVKANEYLQSTFINEFGKAILYGQCATAMYRIGKYAESIDYAQKYFEYADYLNKEAEVYNNQRVTIAEIYLMPENRGRMAAMGMAAAICSKDEKNTLRFAKIYNFEERKPLVDPELCMRKLADNMGNSNNEDVYIELAENVSKQNIYFDMFIARVKEIQNENGALFSKIAQLLCKTDIRHEYVLYLKIIEACMNGNIQNLERLYAEMISTCKNLLECTHEFWSIALQHRIKLGKMIEDKGLGTWMKAVDEWISHANIRDIVERNQDLSGVFEPESMHMRYFGVVLSEAFASRRVIEKSTKAQIVEELDRYSNITLSFYYEIYRMIIFDLYPTMLPIRCQTAVLVRKMISSDSMQEAADIADEIAILTPGLANLVRGYVEKEM